MLKNQRGEVIILGLVALAVLAALLSGVISYTQGKRAGCEQTRGDQVAQTTPAPGR